MKRIKKFISHVWGDIVDSFREDRLTFLAVVGLIIFFILFLINYKIAYLFIFSLIIIVGSLLLILIAKLLFNYLKTKWEISE